jgi:hypothetical protein
MMKKTISDKNIIFILVILLMLPWGPGGSFAQEIDVTHSELVIVDKDTIGLRYITAPGAVYWEAYDWNVMGDLNRDRLLDISDVIMSLRIALGLDLPDYGWTPKASGEDYYWVVPYKIITIDGEFNDWNIGQRVYIDGDGPECGDAPGQDIKEVYVAQDDNYIYLRYIINGPLDPTFGYKFGENLHVFVGADTVNPHGYIAYTTGVADLHSSRFDSSFIYVNNNQFEGRFHKCDLKGWWDERQISGWCDQGRETICRDHIALPKLIFDFSNCNY